MILFLAVVTTTFGACSMKSDNQISAIGTNNPNNNNDNNSGGGGTPVNGSTAIKNFSQYYTSLQAATGVTDAQTAVTVAGVKTTAAGFYAQASLSLPQTTEAGSVTDSAIATGLKMASYFATGFVAVDLARASTARLVIPSTFSTATPASFTQSVAEAVGTNAISYFLHRTATAADLADIDTFYQTTFTNATTKKLVLPTTAAAVTSTLQAEISAILASSEMMSSN